MVGSLFRLLSALQERFVFWLTGPGKRIDNSGLGHVYQQRYKSFPIQDDHHFFFVRPTTTRPTAIHIAGREENSPRHNRHVKKQRQYGVPMTPHENQELPHHHLLQQSDRHSKYFFDGWFLPGMITFQIPRGTVATGRQSYCVSPEFTEEAMG